MHFCNMFKYQYVLHFLLRYLLSMGASTEAENENGEKPADLIDPECKDLAKLFETGCVWLDTGRVQRKANKDYRKKKMSRSRTYPPQLTSRPIP